MREFVSDERISTYVAARTDSVFALGQHTCLGIVQNGQVVAGVVFTAYSGTDIHVTVAGSPGAFTKVFLKRCSHYVWKELGCIRISITTEQHAVADIALRLGAKFEGVKRDAFGLGRDAMMLGLLRNEAAQTLFPR
jgi:hypothetical protein